MRIVHAHQDPQQRCGPGHRQGQGREPGAYERHADRQRDGQGGVVAGERPVARRRTRREGHGPRHGPARPLLVHEELQRLAEPVRDDGGDGRQGGRGQARHVTAAQGPPADEDQEQAQDQQGALARGLQDRPGPRRPVRHAPGQCPVGRRGGALGDVCRFVRAQRAAGCQPDDGDRARTGRRARPCRSPAPSVSGVVRFHGADRRNRGGPPAPAERRSRTPTNVRVAVGPHTP